MISFMRGALAACLCSGVSFVATAQHTVDLASSTAVLDEPLRAVLHLRPWNAAQLEYPVNCVQAEVQYGDFVVPPGQLQWSATPVPEAGHVRVMVYSPLIVNEPLVHLRLTLTCDPQQEHRWTLLTEPPLVIEKPKATPPENVWADSVAGMVALRTSAPAFDTAPAPLIRARAVPALPDRRATAPPAPRLRLDPSDTEVLLQAVRTLLQQRSPSAPEPVVLLGQLQEIQAENQQLKAGMLDLRSQLERLQHPPSSSSWTASAAWLLRDGAPWLVPLGLVVLAAWVLHRRGAERDDSLDRTPLDMGTSRAPLAPAQTRRRMAPRTAAPLQPAPTVRSTATVDRTLPDDLQAEADQLQRGGYPGSVALLLESHLQTEPRVSAPLLLDLLDLYRDMAHAEGQARAAANLTRWFNTHDPLTGQDDGRGLQAHPATLEHITSAWNDPGVCDMLTALMLRPTALEELQLSAFREVLSLYQLAALREGEPHDDDPAGWRLAAQPR